MGQKVDIVKRQSGDNESALSGYLNCPFLVHAAHIVQQISQL